MKTTGKRVRGTKHMKGRVFWGMTDCDLHHMPGSTIILWQQANDIVCVVEVEGGRLSSSKIFLLLACIPVLSLPPSQAVLRSPHK